MWILTRLDRCRRGVAQVLEGVLDARAGVAVDPEPEGGEKRALASAVDEVWPLGHSPLAGVLLRNAGRPSPSCWRREQEHMPGNADRTRGLRC